jgi:hypothetical protein
VGIPEYADEQFHNIHRGEELKKAALIFAIFAASSSLLLLTTDVVTLFAGSHTIQTLTSEQNDISCVDCHQQIQNELNNSALHSDLSCESCHRFNGSGILFAVHNTTGVYAGKEAHASYTPQCLDCHGEGVYVTGKDGFSIYAPPAPEFNEMYGSENSSHKIYVEASINHGFSVGENEACIGCHTNYSTRLEFKRSEYVQYDIVDTDPSWGYGPGLFVDWEIQNFESGAKNISTIMRNGIGQKHTWIENVNCFDCHSDVVTAVENGGHIPNSFNPVGCESKRVKGHAGRSHNFSRSGVDISACESCHLTNSSNFEWDHSGHAQLDYHAATTEHCLNCHKWGALEANNHCCHCPCHALYSYDHCYGSRFPFEHRKLTENMENLPFWSDYLIDKVCIGCHLPGYCVKPLPFPEDQGKARFRVYTEPNATVVYEYHPKVIDNTDATFGGVWPSSTAVAGYYGSDYQYREAGDGSNTCTWIFQINLSGNYRIYAKWTTDSNRASNAPYTVYHHGGSETVRVDQRTGAWQWNELGTYYFEPGTYYVVLSDDADGYVIADAINIEFQ